MSHLPLTKPELYHPAQETLHASCDLFTFELKPLSAHSNSKFTINLDFCPRYSFSRKKVRNIFPRYLNDKKYHSPAFILEIDKVMNDLMEQYVESNYNLEKQWFDQIIRNRQQSQKSRVYNNQIKQKGYCHVCTIDYIAYQEHINSSLHKQFLQKSKANPYIDHLCGLYQEQTKRLNTINFQKQPKTKGHKLKNTSRKKSIASQKDLDLDPTNTNSDHQAKKHKRITKNRTQSNNHTIICS